MPNLGHGSNEGNTGAVEPSATNPALSPIGIMVNGLHCAASHTHTTSLKCHPHVSTFEPCPTWPLFVEKWPSCSCASAGERRRELKGRSGGLPVRPRAE